MPESPEVSELASYLTRHAVGHTITRVDIVVGKALKTRHPSPLDLVGGRIAGVRRHGKMIDIEVADTGRVDAALHVVVHFGHDGWVQWHERVPGGLARAGAATLMARVRLDDGSGFDLTDSGQWKGLTIHVVGSAVEVPAIAKLGPDPLDPDFDRDAFSTIVGGRKKQIKALLQDQTVFAGIGNAYSDEILHAARISPIVHGASLTVDERARLAEQTVIVLAAATRARRGVQPDDLRDTKRAGLRVHRRPGQACPVCGDEIREFTFSGAAAQYCPTCQNAGVLLGEAEPPVAEAASMGE